MRLLRVALTDVRGVAQCDVPFAAEGVTVVEAPNESGKTTLLDAVDVVLEYKDSSKARLVKDLQPIDRDVPCTIEVELTCGPYHLTCRKTYLKQCATLLTIHAPTPEVLRGDEAHDRLRAILQQDVDLALYAALRFTQGRELTALSLGDSQVLAARLDASAGGQGDTDDGGLLDRAEREYLGWWTVTGRPGKALRALDEALVRAQDRREDLAIRTRELDRAVADLAEVERELPELRRRRDELVPAVEQARAELARVAQAESELTARRAQRDRCETTLDQAERAVGHRRELVARHAQLVREVDDLEQQLEPRRRRVEERRERRDHDQQAVLAATRDLDAVRHELDRARLAVDLGAVERDRTALRARVRAVAELTAAGRDAERALAAIQLDDDAMKRIQAAADDLRVARATLVAGAPQLRVRALQPLELREHTVEPDAGADPAPRRLAAGEGWDRTVGGVTRIQLDDRVEVEVAAGSSAEVLQTGCEAAATELAEACRAAGVADLDEAYLVDAARARHEQVLAQRDQQLEQQLGGGTAEDLAAELRAVEDRADALAARWAASGQGADGTAELPLVPSPGAAGELVDTADHAVRAAEARLAAAREQLEVSRTALHEERTALEVAAAQLTERRTERDRLGEVLASDRAEHSDDRLATAVDTARRARDEAAVRVADAERALAQLDPEAAQLHAGNLAAQLDDVAGRLRDREQRDATLRERLRLAGEDGLGEELAAAEEELAHAQAEHRRGTARAAAVALLRDTLRAARDEAYLAYRAPLADRIAAKARLVLGGDVEVVLGDDLAIQARTRDGGTLRWDQLSAGAREQLAILAALSAAELAGSDGVPFVLDDALGYADPDRLARIGAILGRTRDAQVVVLTCVAERFRHVGGAHTVRLLECTG